MKKILILGILFLSFLGLASCDQEGITTFKSADSIYFSNSVFANITINGAKTLVDSTGFSFALEKATVTEMIYPIPIQVQGNISKVDRKVKVTIDPKSNAVEGTHFKLPENIILRAGNVRDTILVTVFRTPDMKQKGFQLILNLEENEFFKTEMKSTQIGLTQKRMNHISYKLTFDDKVTQPPGWYVGHFGVFSAKKLFLMCELMSLDPAMFNQKLGAVGLGLADTAYYQSFMKRYLADQKASGNTVYEEDGKEMVFP